MIELDVIDATSDGADASGKRFWRSPADLQRTADFQEVHKEEFQPGTSEPPGGASRRQFLQLMGASMALAGLTACRRPVQKILPYARKPEEVIPGVSQQYATAMPFRGILRPLVVEAHEGRPTKVEGNPDHPEAHGGASGFEQASVLNLYDPDRSRELLQEGSPAAWDDFLSVVRRLADGADERQIAVLADESSSITMAALRDQLQDRFPQLRWITYRPVGDDPVALGMQQAFGRPLRPLYQFDDAEVIVSLDADFLSGVERNYGHNTRTFAAARKLETADDEMSRLYTVESAYSITGGMADHRLRMKSSRVPALAAALCAELGVGPGTDASFTEAEQLYITEMARDLRDAGSQGVLVAGETQPAAVHALCMAANDALGSIGTTVQLLDPGTDTQPAQSGALNTLVQDMRNGQMDAVVMIDVNPVYDAPASLDFESALNAVDTSIHMGLYVDETARASQWHVPQAHYLEAWGDGRSYDGTASVIQPLIRPLYDDARSDIELVNILATGVDAAAYDLVRTQWRDRLDGPFEQSWRRVIHDGYLPDSGYDTVAPTANTANLRSIPAPSDEMELVFRLSPTLLDGRFANNAWMQELPDPTTKIVWDNVALMNAATAEALGVEVEYDKGNFLVDRVQISHDGTSVELPVWIQPGLPDGSISVTMGYGRRLSSNRPERSTPFWDTDDYTDVYGDGPLGNGVGQNVAPLRDVSMTSVATGAEVQRTESDKYLIATTQEHGSMEGRPIARWATLQEFRENPDFAGEMGAPVPGSDAEGDAGYDEYPMLWEENHPSETPALKDNPYYKNQWGMTIDLNSCTGCNACVVACTSENNVQVIGKEEVSRGRHMYWLRTDRYYVSDEERADDPEMLMQPLPCQHCENAPCEAVCPVAATVHSPDGTNQMIYNRCIGTRYCQNNCPYKVRRFNFFNWSKTLPTEVQMAQNPNVTMRFRGVMEKCTFCVQRIRDAQQHAQNEDRRVVDGEVETACQQACPADAIIFGDLNDQESRVVYERENPRRYELLAYLNTKPRVSYLARVRNTNPRLAEDGNQQLQAETA
jgi:molybdopterin-containing oxidoreductase family iron-sulfur binding subunit